jgi:erythrocyte band 7 integral membrane protein
MLPMVRVILSESLFSPNPHKSATTTIVTDDIPHDHHHTGMNPRVIKVQPLKKDEMQPSYAQDMGISTVTHGFYGSMMQTLGSCVGFCGAIPCCPLPNPFKEVRQGRFSLMVPNLHRSLIYSFFSNNGSLVTGSVGLVSRFGQFYKAVDPGLVQVNVFTESLRVVDVKIQIISIGRQTVITRDNVNVEMYVPLLFFQLFPSPTSPSFYSFYSWVDGLTQQTVTTQ